MKMSMKWIALVAVALMVMPSMGFAASPWKEKGGSYSDMAKNKLDFGLKNLLAGWTELIAQPAKAKDIGSFATGLGRGIYNAVVDTVGGALHTATFPITAIDVPLPDNGLQL